MGFMDVSEFQDEIAKWRIEAGFTQPELDEKCKLRRGTVGRLEQKKLKMTEDHFLRILICTKRDLVWTLLESCGSLLARLQPLEAELSKRFRAGPNSYKPLIDEDFQNGLAELLSGAQVVLTKMARAADPKAWAIDLLLRAASQGDADDQPKRHRVRAKRENPHSQA
jgi:transcriptional regulator with XRE-family HTH domain